MTSIALILFPPAFVSLVFVARHFVLRHRRAHLPGWKVLYEDTNPAWQPVGIVVAATRDEAAREAIRLLIRHSGRWGSPGPIAAKALHPFRVERLND